MTLYHSTGIIAASLSAAKPGMVLLKPTSIAHSGTSASIGANGQVTFTAVTSLSLNGVFSATYDNYFIAIRGNVASENVITLRLRASGTDASGTDYTWQLLTADSTSVVGLRSTSQTSYRFNTFSSNAENGCVVNVYGPNLAQATAMRSVTNRGAGPHIYDIAGTHSLATSYDGCSFIPTSTNMTGALQVYGVRG